MDYMIGDIIVENIKPEAEREKAVLSLIAAYAGAVLQAHTDIKEKEREKDV